MTCSPPPSHPFPLCPLPLYRACAVLLNAVPPTPSPCGCSTWIDVLEHRAVFVPVWCLTVYGIRSVRSTVLIEIEFGSAPPPPSQVLCSNELERHMLSVSTCPMQARLGSSEFLHSPDASLSNSQLSRALTKGRSSRNSRSLGLNT